MIDKTWKTQIDNLAALNIDLGKQLSMVHKENDENSNWRDAVTNALMDNMGVDIDLETAVGEINAIKDACKEYENSREMIIENLEDVIDNLRNPHSQTIEEEKESESYDRDSESYRKQLMYAENWRDAVTDALLDSVGSTISHQRAIEIINDLKKRAQESRESVQETTQNIDYDEVIKFLTNCSAQKDELYRLNKQCAYFRREIKTMEDRIEKVRKGVEDGRYKLVTSLKKD